MMLMLTQDSHRLTQEQNHNTLRLNLFLGFILCVAAVLLFATLAKSIVSSGQIVQYDQRIATDLHASASPNETMAFKLITLLGFQGLWIVVAGLAIYLLYKRHFAQLTVWLIGYLGGELLNAALKMVFNRPRPVFTDPLLTAANASFPSGHAMASLVVYGLLTFLILIRMRKTILRLAIILVAITLIVLIGISRIYLGVHYFSDVMGGYIVGSAWLIVCISALNFFERKNGPGLSER
jgi:membrane-associated phospholipid phosphatase